jgi:uncharacterized protein YjdB
MGPVRRRCNLINSLCALVTIFLVLAIAGCGSSNTTTPKTLMSVAATPATATLAVGTTQKFGVMGTFSDGSTGDVSSNATWASKSTAVATISTTGLATAVAIGSTTVTATVNGETATATLTVTAAAPTLVSIAVTPSTPGIAPATTLKFYATGTYSDGSAKDVTSTVTWTSSNTTVATIIATGTTAGLATGVAVGSTTITATLGAVSGNTTMQVAVPATLLSITLTPTTPTTVTGATLQFTVTGNYSDGTIKDVTSSAAWTSSNTSVATINASGLATPVAAGSTTVTAVVGNLSQGTVMTVKALSSLAVTPNSAKFGAGTTQQFTATATFTDSTKGDVSNTSTWTIANTAVATVNSTGLVTGVASGPATVITASLGGKTATATFTITSDVLTWHFDTARTGNNSQEAWLTPASVSAQTFGKLFSYQTDGYIYGEPVLKSGVTINGAVHNVVYVATENDSVYAFDADNFGTGAPLWMKSLLQTGETPLTNGPVQPVEGITSTPVIDSTTNTIYVVSSQTSAAAGGGFFRLHALDITTGAEKFGGPVKLNVSVPATNSDSSGGVQTLTTSCIQRAALLEANGNIYMGFASCHSGWLVAYSASTLAQVGVFNASVTLNGEGPYASAGGIWMGAGGPVADSAGNVYVTTGNGPWNGTDAWGDSFLKFPPTPVKGANGTMQPTDWFTPSIYQYMDCQDSDLAAGGLLLMPNANQLVAGGKTGTIYVVNSANLGKETANDSGVTQEQVWGAGLTNGGTYQSSCPDVNGTTYTANITSYEIFGTSAYYNNNVYLGVTPTNVNIPAGVRQFTVSSSGMLAPATGNPSLPAQNQGTRGTSPFISSNGATDGIVWMIDQGYPIQNTNKEPGTGVSSPPTNATLYAYKADQFPTELYDSSMNAADTPGYGIKFSSPVVANGKVYISTAHDLNTVANPKGELDVYGLK